MLLLIEEVRKIRSWESYMNMRLELFLY